MFGLCTLIVAIFDGTLTEADLYAELSVRRVAAAAEQNDRCRLVGIGEFGRVVSRDVEVRLGR